MDDTTRKDTILERIVQLEKDLTDRRADRVQKALETKAKKQAVDDMKIVFEETQRAYWNSQDSHNAAVKELRDIDSKGKAEAAELEALKREFNRLRDAEAINEAYLQQVAAFKERCLIAPWRKENRTDGIGALDHQMDGAIHLAVTKEALLGDKRGLGKTLTALITLDLVEARKVIAVVPADSVENFVREVAMWVPHRNPIIITGMNKMQRDFFLKALKNAPEWLIVMNYEAWNFDSHVMEDLIALQPDALIADEAHRGKSMKTLAGQGLQRLRYSINTCPLCNAPDVKFNPLTKERPEDEYTCWCGHTGPLHDFLSIKYVFPISGTFILNRPQELFPLLRLVDIYNFWSESLYLKDFTQKIGPSLYIWTAGGEKQLMKKIGPRYIARDRKSAGVVIPPVEPVDHYLRLPDLQLTHPDQHEAYIQIQKFMELAFTEDDTMDIPEMIVRLMRMRQVLVWPAMIEYAIKDENGNTKKILRLDVRESWKIDQAETMINELNEEGERVVVFSQFRPGLHELQRRLGLRTAIYDGTSSRRLRNDIQLDFDVKTAPKSPRWDNVLSSYKAGGEALNFNTASRMIFLDREWNPGREDQATGRMDRMGQTKDTYLHKLIIGPTVDTWMGNLIDNKAQMIGGFEVEAEMYKKAYEALRNGEM